MRQTHRHANATGDRRQAGSFSHANQSQGRAASVTLCPNANGLDLWANPGRRPGLLRARARLPAGGEFGRRAWDSLRLSSAGLPRPVTIPGCKRGQRPAVASAGGATGSLPVI